MKETWVSRMSVRAGLSLLVVCLVWGAYSNHFHNDFHFDDLTAIPGNPAIRNLEAVPKAFFDASLFSSAAEQRTYRPVTVASLAIDRWLTGSRLSTFYFHLSTFLWFSLQLILMVLLFERILNLADPHPSNLWAAVAAAALFGLHPVNAETLNFVIQRADLYDALGCVASLLLFIRFRSQRKFGWYLVPALAAMLAKPPAIAFPLLLLGYVILFEQDTGPVRQRLIRSLRPIWPAVAISSAVTILLARMQTGTWHGGAVSASLYRITQPWVALHYFKSFFLPTELNVDPGWKYVDGPLSLQAVVGYLFVLGLLAAMVATSRTRRGKPIAFGIFWFVAALLPTSLMALKDVMNDHRMFFPFVGLTLAVLWSVRLAIFQETASLTTRRYVAGGAVVAMALVLAMAGAAVHQRNRVWSSEESLWRDATQKNPRNARAWNNYGAAFYAQGDYERAISYWQRAVALDPACTACEADLVRGSLALGRDDMAEFHMQRLLAINPSTPDVYIVYAAWLKSAGRFEEGSRLLDRALQLFPRAGEVWEARLNLLLRRDAADRIAVWRQLDVDRDTSLSLEELIAAPAVLRAMDSNGDGKLSAEECGAGFGDERLLSAEVLRQARKGFMRANPLLHALDTNDDGEISGEEILEAERRLATLDVDGDGKVDTSEMVPPDVATAARQVLDLLDCNHNGTIDAGEWSGEMGRRFLNFLKAADVDGNGVVTFEELTNEIFYRADRDRNGLISADEMKEVVRSGLLPLTVGPEHRG